MSEAIEKLKELFLSSTKFFLNNILSFSKIALVVFIPLVFFDRYFYMETSLDQIPTAYLVGTEVFFRGRSYSILNFALIALIVVCVTISLFFLYQVAILKLIHFLRLKKQVNVLTYYKEAWKIAGAYAFVVCLVSFFAAAWSLLFIIPGLVVGCFYSFSIFALIFDGHKGTDALEFSKGLIKPNIKEFMFLFLSMSVITVSIYALLIYVIEVVFRVHKECEFAIIPATGEILQDAVTILAICYPLIFLSFMYERFKGNQEKLNKTA